jgi:hypothetical protein
MSAAPATGLAPMAARDELSLMTHLAAFEFAAAPEPSAATAGWWKARARRYRSRA